MKVNEAMTAPVKCCSPEENLDEVARMMWDGDCGAIPVVEGGKRPIGIVTDRDIAMCAMHRHQPLWEIKAWQVIENQNLVCCNQQDSVEDCVQAMEEAQVRRIVVTDDEGSVCGILSMGDAVAFAESDHDNDDQPAVENEQLMDMLRSVSAHHESGGNHPLLQTQVTQGY